MKLRLSKPLLAVASSGFTDFGVAWALAALAADNKIILLKDITAAIVSLVIAYRAERLLRETHP